MNPDGLAKFYQAFETYTGLTREDADEFLSIKINLDKVHQVSVQHCIKHRKHESMFIEYLLEFSRIFRIILTSC